MSINRRVKGKFQEKGLYDESFIHMSRRDTIDKLEKVRTQGKEEKGLELVIARRSDSVW